MFEDSTFWLFVAPGLLLGLYAQARIKANYVRYSRVGTTGGIAGAQVARALLDARGLQGVQIESTPGAEPPLRSAVERQRASPHMKLAMRCKMPPVICLLKRDR